ncbi:MAG: hypothetical protein EXX96DRAFT_473971 [Benjaminiella poitrasii]|nr:MAG: hypothetical protein EXX96DRAFT_473971 [Benjaminiella poitrasii]
MASNNAIIKQEELNNDADDFDMHMDEDEDSDCDFSPDESSTPPPSSSPSSSTSTSIIPLATTTNATLANNNNKRPVTQALFLNFTSDLSPQKMSKKKNKPKKQTAYRVNGVNILNRNNLDSKTAIERIQRRRENHNHVERRRRDNINNIIFELSSVVPNAIQQGQKPNKGNILKLSLDYIKELQAENNMLKERMNQCASCSHLLSSISPHLNAAIQQDKTTTNFSFQQQQSPSAPNSPLYVRNSNHHNLRPLAQATKPQRPPTIQTHQTPLLPSLRMSGYEKIYGNVCRY